MGCKGPSREGRMRVVDSRLQVIRYYGPRMPSVALTRWRTEGVEALDQLVAAHRAVRGVHRGRRHATRELNHAYAVLLASQFQHFCRNLHSEAVESLANGVAPASLGGILRKNLLNSRQLDNKNAQPGSLGSDFNRLGFDFTADIGGRDPKNVMRLKRLNELNNWRNAIAHQDFAGTKTKSLAPSPPLHLEHVRRWRKACDALARSMDAVVGDQVLAVVGVRPW